MSKMMTGADIVMIPLDKVVPNDFNPQTMSDAKFNELVDEIREDGFDEPILVVPHPDAGDTYMIISGEHRHGACKVLGFDEVPCIIKTDWDERDQRIKTVRRNLLRGEIDKPKFSKLVHSLNEDAGIAVKDMPGMMGFKDEAEFRDHLIAKQTKKDAEATAGAVKRAKEDDKREIQVIDNLSYILNEILSQYGTDVPSGFIFFWYKNKFHLMVQEDDKLERDVESMVKYLRETGKNVTTFLKRALDLAFAKVQAEDGTDPRKTRAISNKAGS